MKIGVIGAGGRLGGKISTEALDRGMDVTAIIHRTPCRDGRASVMKKDLFDLKREDISGFGALISAFGSGFTADPAINKQAIAHLAEIAVGTGIHLIMIGGAGCLYADGSETVCVYEMPDHPAFLKGISWNLVQGYEQLKHTDDVDWTFVCPAGYKGISDKGRRIAAFYRDGFAAISGALGIMRIFVGIRLRGAEAF